MTKEQIEAIADRATEVEAEEAGKDYGRNGANTENCHFRFFATRELTQAWERGRDRHDQGTNPGNR